MGYSSLTVLDDETTKRSRDDDSRGLEEMHRLQHLHPDMPSAPSSATSPFEVPSVASSLTLK